MTLDGKRILIAEDEYLTAMDLKRFLADQGAEVVDPVNDLAKGLLDINFGIAAAAIDTVSDATDVRLRDLPDRVEVLPDRPLVDRENIGRLGRWCDTTSTRFQ